MLKTTGNAIYLLFIMANYLLLFNMAKYMLFFNRANYMYQLFHGKLPVVLKMANYLFFIMAN